jgi:NADH:ubiquinone oxidoreductase subunit E
MNKTDILHKYPPVMENVLLILHEFQNSNPHHYLFENDLAMIARYLNVPDSSIYGVVSYYTMFSLTPRGNHIIRVCNSPVCQMANSNDILRELRNYLAIDTGATTSDGVFTLETTECLGQCDTAPGMSVDEEYYGNLTAKTIKRIIKSWYANTESH